MDLIGEAVSRRQNRGKRSRGSKTTRGNGSTSQKNGALFPGVRNHELKDLLATLRDARLMPSAAENSIVTNEYRQIKRPIISHALGRKATLIPKGNVVQVTSSLPAEGKTFTSANLALSIGKEQDVSVLLVDADFPKRQLTSVLGTTESPGLTDLLSDDSLRLDDVVLQTDVPKIWFLPAGQATPDTSELLSSERMEQVINELVERSPNLITVMDSSPLLLTNEARQLTSFAGQIVFVIKAAETLRRIVTEALEHVDPEAAVNLLFNQTTRSSQGAYNAAGYPNAGEQTATEMELAQAN